MNDITGFSDPHAPLQSKFTKPGDEPVVPVQINAPSDLDVCTWTSDVDEKRRAFVVSQMVDGDVDGKVMVTNMHAVCEWLKTGTLSESSEAKPYRPFKPVAHHPV